VEEGLSATFGATELAQPKARSERVATQADLSRFGYYFALFVSGALFLAAAVYLFLFVFMASSNFGETRESLISGRLDAVSGVVVAQMDSFLIAITLNSCGVFLGLALAFVGLALFLIGVKGSVDASGKGAGYQLHLSNLSPGLFVSVLSAIVVLACCVWRPSLNIDAKANGTAKSNQVISNSDLSSSNLLSPNKPL
jgi:hypothetical protein